MAEVAAKAKALKVSVGTEPNADIGPLISVSARKRVEDIIQSAVDEGAKLVLDGRGVKVDGYPNVSAYIWGLAQLRSKSRLFDECARSTEVRFIYWLF
jgi:acyl-CoA reductase-like NAD-dependent aldehyde dehydrogenase